MSQLILHEDPLSGNCYKIRLTAALLGLPLERRRYHILNGETRTPEFLREVNGNGRIPVLQIGQRFLPESNAACWYLAQGTPLVPRDPFTQADTLRWMFWEQYNHEPNIATVRFWLAYVGKNKLTPLQREMLPGKIEGGNSALKLMEEHLASNQWFAGTTPTIADIALYAYTHVAEQGGAFSLGAYPAVSAWLQRVVDLPGYVSIDD